MKLRFNWKSQNYIKKQYSFIWIKDEKFPKYNTFNNKQILLPIFNTLTEKDNIDFLKKRIGVEHINYDLVIDIYKKSDLEKLLKIIENNSDQLRIRFDWKSKNFAKKAISFIWITKQEFPKKSKFNNEQVLMLYKYPKEKEIFNNFRKVTRVKDIKYDLVVNIYRKNQLERLFGIIRRDNTIKNIPTLIVNEDGVFTIRNALSFKED